MHRLLSPAHRYRTARDRAFSLVELAVVLIVVGIIAAIAIATFSQVVANAHDKRAAATLTALVSEAQALAAQRGESGYTQDDFDTALADLPPGSFASAPGVFAQVSWVLNVDGSSLELNEIALALGTGPQEGAAGLALRSVTGKCALLLTERPGAPAQSWVSDEDLDTGCSGATALAGPGNAPVDPPPSSTTTTTEAPQAPVGAITLDAVAADGQVSLVWTAASGLVDGYNIYVDDVLWGTEAGLSAVVEPLTNGQSYTFTVAAFGPGGEGTPSDPVTRTPAPPLSVLYTSTAFNVNASEEVFAPDTTGGVGPFSYSVSGTLPSGVTFDEATGEFTGAAAWERGFTHISTGGRHACGIDTEGGAWCWGLNNHGQLGNGTTTSSNTPVQVAGMESGVVAIAASQINSISPSDAHTCAVHETQLKCWGSNSNGQLGNGTTTASTTPVVVSGGYSITTTDRSQAMRRISAGDRFTCATTTNSAELRCWGRNTSGQLGNASTTQSTTPVLVNFTSTGSGITQVSAGTSHVCAVRIGAAWCWGFGSNGRLGNSSTANATSPVRPTGWSTDLNGVTRIAAGSNHTCAIRNSTVSCWGNNSNGQLGNNSTTESTSPVSIVAATANFVEVTAGDGNSGALRSTGVSLFWGRNNVGQRAHSTTSDVQLPTQPNGFESNSGITSINLGGAFSGAFGCGLRNDVALCWGSNSNGQLGTGSATPGSSTTALGVIGFGGRDTFDSTVTVTVTDSVGNTTTADVNLTL